MKKEIKNTVQQLQQGITILYPTDSVWGLGCSIFSKEAIDNIYKIKNREESKTLCILVSDTEMLQEYVELNSKIRLLINSGKPTTIIYSKVKNMPSSLLADDGSVAIRIPKDEFCIELIKQFGSPIISTSANVSGEFTPQNYSEINQTILRDVDYVVNWRQDDLTVGFPSQIVKVNEDGNIQIIRK